MKKIIFTVLLFALTACSSNHTLFAPFVEKNEYGFEKSTSEVFVLKGEINLDKRNDFDNFLKNLNPNTKTIIMDLNTSGGSTSAALKIQTTMLQLRDKDFIVVAYVNKKSICMSACTMIFATAEKRITHSNTMWLFHSPWVFRPTFDIEKSDFSEEGKKYIRTQLTQSRELMYYSYVLADPDFANWLWTNYISKHNSNYKLTGKQLFETTKTYVTQFVQDEDVSSDKK